MDVVPLTHGRSMSLIFCQQAKRKRLGEEAIKWTGFLKTRVLWSHGGIEIVRKVPRLNSISVVLACRPILILQQVNLTLSRHILSPISKSMNHLLTHCKFFHAPFYNENVCMAVAPFASYKCSWTGLWLFSARPPIIIDVDRLKLHF